MKCKNHVVNLYMVLEVKAINTSFAAFPQLLMSNKHLPEKEEF